MKMSILTKLILLMGFCVFASIASILYFSSRKITEDSIKNENAADLEATVAKSIEVENTLNRLSDQIQRLGLLALRAQTDHSKTLAPLLESAFKSDKNLLSFRLIELRNKQGKVLVQLIQSDQLKTYGIEESYLQGLKFPFLSVAESKNADIQNSSDLSGKMALISFGIPLAKNELDQVTHVVVAEVPLVLLQKLFVNKTSFRNYFLADKNLKALAHYDESLALRQALLSDNPFLAKGAESRNPQTQFRAIPPHRREPYYGTVVKNTYGLYTVSEVPESIVLSTAESVKRSIFMIAGVVGSSVLFLVVFFSLGISSNIEKLVSLMREVAKGNLDVIARKSVKSEDEIGTLAKAFDKMTEGLKEKARYALQFKKLHGAVMAEEIMSGKLNTKGESRNVVVFFSDIRGFTSFSEKHNPKAVVSMLNEYFTVMVKIINQNHGIVDKFIGDAIMAFWGAPKSNGNEAFNAIKATLEMRQALNHLNEKRIARGEQPIWIGMGLHKGPANCGYIGSDDKEEYTVIGDTVNLSSRIESSTKAFGADCLISEGLANEVSEQFALEMVGSAEVKGKSEALNLYRVIGFKSDNGRVLKIETPYSTYQKEKSEKVHVA